MTTSTEELLAWKPVSPPRPIVMRGRYVTLEPLDADRHTPSLWQAVCGHDEVWTWLSDGPYACEADLYEAIASKQASTNAVFFAILPEQAASVNTTHAGPAKLPGAGSSVSTPLPAEAGHPAAPAETSHPAEARHSAASGNPASGVPAGTGYPAAPGSPAAPGCPAAAGYASYMRIEPAHGVVEVGNILFSPRLQRTRAATEAMYLMARYVFEDLGYRRYEWKCNARNEPSRGAALRLGFSFEGIFRQHMVIKGRNRDTAWFAMLDSDWAARKAAFEQWLDPANFDEMGTQLRSLGAS